MLGVRQPARGVGLLLLVVSAGSGCSLILDFAGDITDAGVGDGSTTDATDTCTVDEPNDALAMPVALAVGPLDASICPKGDHDFYSFALDGTQDLVVTVTFDGAAGTEDLELRLYDATAGTVITVSTGLDDDERIEQSAALANRLPAGNYAIEIFGRDDAVKNSYHLELAITGA